MFSCLMLALRRVCQHQLPSLQEVLRVALYILSAILQCTDQIYPQGRRASMAAVRPSHKTQTFATVPSAVSAFTHQRLDTCRCATIRPDVAESPVRNGTKVSHDRCLPGFNEPLWVFPGCEHSLSGLVLVSCGGPARPATREAARQVNSYDDRRCGTAVGFGLNPRSPSQRFSHSGGAELP
jgi:hypothetical protein